MVKCFIFLAYTRGLHKKKAQQDGSQGGDPRNLSWKIQVKGQLGSDTENPEWHNDS